jgi:hypothetical protein
MTTNADPLNASDAVRRFAADLARRGQRPDRIQAQLGGRDGMAVLCLVEAAISQSWPPTTAKELIWLGGAGDRNADTLRLQAFAPDGERLHAATYSLGLVSVGAA